MVKGIDIIFVQNAGNQIIGLGQQWTENIGHNSSENAVWVKEGNYQDTAADQENYRYCQYGISKPAEGL